MPLVSPVLSDKMSKQPSAKNKKRKEQKSASLNKQENSCHKLWDDIAKAREAGDEKRQEELLKACLAICKSFEESHSMRLSTEIALASLFAAQGRHEDTMPFLESALSRIRTHHRQNHEFFADTYLHASACYRNLGRNSQAERLASAALKTATEHKLKKLLTECHATITH